MPLGTHLISRIRGLERLSNFDFKSKIECDIEIKIRVWISIQIQGLNSSDSNKIG
jgi:hypothetical protein